MMRACVRLALPALVILVLAGCGDSATRVVLPVEDKSKPASELTTTEIRGICKETIGAVKRSYGPDVCSAQGLAASYQNEGSCPAVRDECMGEMFEKALSSCETGEVEPIECDVPMSDVERCMNDTLALLDDLPRIDCSMSIEELQKVDVSKLTNMSAPSSCKAVQEACGDEFKLDIGVGTDVEQQPIDPSST